VKVLLDTHTFIWYVLDSEKLSDTTLGLISIAMFGHRPFSSTFLNEVLEQIINDCVRR
jgi:hypothetical protein